jgi:hypothetical protein
VATTGEDVLKIRIRTAWVLLAVASAFAIALVGAGCGGGEGASPDAALAEAATKTAEAGTSRISLDVETKVSGAEPVAFTGTGAFDYEGKRGHMMMDMSELMEASGAPPGQGQMEVVFDELVVYMKFPLLTEQIPGDKEWVKIDLDAVGKQQGVDLGALSNLNQGDPTQALQYLKATSGGVEEVGREEVRGEDTTHYRATIDLRKVPDAAPPEERERIRRTIEQVVGASGESEIPTDVWVDDEGRVRRQRYTQKIPAGPDTGEMTFTMELFDFGVEVDAEPPPAGQVTDISKLIGKS